jgi:mono/diheme cytochrome c family protein
MKGAAILLLSFFCVGCRRKTAVPREDGAALYAATCARCHGIGGWGAMVTDSGAPTRNFRDRDFQRSRTNDDLRKAIVAGKGAGMPAYGTAFTAEQLDAIVAELRGFDTRESP